MARQARQYSSTGFYHVVFRGVNRCHIFEESDDYNKMIDLLTRVIEELNMEIHAYCLMSNHAHLLIHEQSTADIVTAMRKVLGPYANWFNAKYDRCGALIANRYKSKCVEDDSYLLSLVRYIHLNPVEAGLVSFPHQYHWSSYSSYLSNESSMTTIGFVLSLFPNDKEGGLEGFMQFHNLDQLEDHSMQDKVRRTPKELLDAIVAMTGDAGTHCLPGLPKLERDAILSSLRDQGFSIRQIERATGISRGIIAKARG